MFMKRVMLLVALTKQLQPWRPGLYHYYNIYKLCSPFYCEA